MKLSQITASHDKWELIVICRSSIIHQGKYTIKYFRYAAPVSPVLTQTIDQQEHGMKPHPLKWSFRQSYYNELYVPRYSYKTDIIALNRWKYCFFFSKLQWQITYEHTIISFDCSQYSAFWPRLYVKYALAQKNISTQRQNSNGK